MKNRDIEEWENEESQYLPGKKLFFVHSDYEQGQKIIVCRTSEWKRKYRKQTCKTFCLKSVAFLFESRLCRVLFFKGWVLPCIIKKTRLLRLPTQTIQSLQMSVWEGNVVIEKHTFRVIYKKRCKYLSIISTVRFNTLSQKLLQFPTSITELPAHPLEGG